MNENHVQTKTLEEAYALLEKEREPTKERRDYLSGLADFVGFAAYVMQLAINDEFPNKKIQLIQLLAVRARLDRLMKNVPPVTPYFVPEKWSCHQKKEDLK